MEDIDYTKIESCFLGGICGTDAMKWATAFTQHIEKLDLEIDENLMVGWFANAMEQTRPNTMTEEESVHIASRIWCRPETRHITMDHALACAFADVLRNGELK